jgi:hypothetical protein
MKIFLSILLYLLIIFALLQNQLIVVVVAVGLFTFTVGAAWLLPMAILLDGYFGAFSQIPVISLSFLLWYIASEYIKPRLLVQS